MLLLKGDYRTDRDDSRPSRKGWTYKLYKITVYYTLAIAI